MFGIHLFGTNKPSGSPLDPKRAGVLSNPTDILAPVPAIEEAPAAPTGALATQAPPSVKRKKLSPWDKEHISATLAQMSKGFASSDNFVGGLANAVSNVADQTAAWRKAAMGSTEVGGPDNAFEIHTDEDGNRTYTPITGVQEYLTNKEKLKDRPKPADNANYLGDIAYAVEQLPEEQRPGAYQLALQQAHDAGYDVSTAPPEYSPTFAKYMIARTIGARQGATNEATRQYRDEVNADRDAARALTELRTRTSIANSTAANARAERKARTAPPSTRRKNDDLDYLR